MTQDTKDKSIIFVNKIQYLIGELGYKFLCVSKLSDYSSSVFQQIQELRYVLEYFTSPQFDSYADQPVLQLIDFFEARYNFNDIPYINYPKRVTVIEDVINLDSLDQRYVRKNGDVMTGPLTVLSTVTHEPATLPNHSTTLSQVISLIATELLNYYTQEQVDNNFYPLNSNPAGYLTQETDPVFNAWLTTNPFNGFATELWVNTNFYTKTQSDNRYYPLLTNPAGYLTSETDPVFNAWLSTNPFAGLASETWVTQNFYPLNSNPAGYLTSFTETDPVFTSWLATNPFNGYATETWVNTNFYDKTTADGRFYPLSLNPAGYLTSVDLAGYVPYTGATQNVNLGKFGIFAGHVTLDNTPTNIPTTQGTMYWNVDNETISAVLNGYTMQIGEDTFYPVKNQTGTSIPKGTAVRFAGTVGNSGRLLIAPFIANGTLPSSLFMGVTAEDIPNGEDGKVLWFGKLRGINTNSFNEGDVLYASTTVAGGFQTAVPVAPNNIVQIAAVVTKSATVGEIFIRPQLGSNINNDEGVKITSPATGQLLQLQSSGLWENRTLAQILGGTSTQFVKGDGSLDSNVYALQSALSSYQLLSEKGQPNGYASLDGGGKVPAAQLPSYVDDVLEFANLASFPATGETGKIYIAIDTNRSYRWTGSNYVEVSPSIGTDLSYNATTRILSSSTGTGVTLPLATTSLAGLMSATDKTKLDGIAVNADNYGSWLLAAGGVSGTQSITSGATATFSATSPITVSRSGGTITYGHANSGVTAGTYNNVTVNALGHVIQGSNVPYLTSFTETDPTVPSHVKSITTTNISNWNTAFGWGNHASAGYAFANGSNATGTWGINVTGSAGSLSNDSHYFRSRGSVLNESALDSQTFNGFSIVIRPGFTTTLWQTNAGGSAGTVQHEYDYNTPVRGWRVRNRTDNITWSNWGWVVMTTQNQGHISGNLWHTGNLSSPIQGSGTTNFLAKFTGAGTIGNSLIFDNGSFVGIGTTNPLFQLHINKAGGTGVFVSNTTADTGAYLFAGTNVELQAANSINSNPKNLFIQPYGGNVLIGTTSELTGGGRLQVGGTGGINVLTGVNENDFGLKFRNSLATSYSGVGFFNNSDQVSGYLLLRNGVSTDVYTTGGITLVSDTGDLNLAARGASRIIRFYTNGATQRGTLDGSGNLAVTGDIIAFSSSDARLKDNLTRITDPIEKVLKLGGYRFDWNNNQSVYKGSDYGVIAQEVEAVFPELVQTRDNGYKAVKYEKLVPVLIEAIKELSNKVKVLEGK